MKHDPKTPTGTALSLFFYKAVNCDGKKTSGEIEAGSESAVLKELSKLSLTPISITKSGNQTSRARSFLEFKLFANKSIPLKTQAAFLRALSRLLSAQIPLLDSLRYALESTPSKLLDLLGEQVVADVENGSSLTTAFKKQTENFAPIVIALISVGEKTNTLAETTSNCATRMETAIQIRSRLQSALVYPSFLILMSIAVMGLILFHLLPTLEPFFAQQGSQPPAGIRAMVLIRDFLVNYKIEMFVAFTGFFFVGASIVRLQTQVFERALFGLPLLGGIIKRTENAQLAATLSLALNSGATLPTALEIASASSRRKLIQITIQKVSEAVKEGQSLSAALRKETYISEVFKNFVAIGEKSNQLAALCQSTADVLGDEQKQQIDRLLGILTPIMTIAIGLLIGTVVLSAITAITEVNSSVF